MLFETVIIMIVTMALFTKVDELINDFKLSGASSFIIRTVFITGCYLTATLIVTQIGLVLNSLIG